MERIRRHLSYANVAATLALLFAMSGGAIAATGGFTGSGGKLQACVNDEGALKLLKAGKHCKRGQKTVGWNQTGPTGAKGTPGVAGAAGATGPSGSAGASAVTLWAFVGPEGQLFESSGVTGVTGADPYKVKFTRDVSKCALSATLNAGPAETAYALPEEDPTVVGVGTTDSVGVAKGAFTLLVTCP